MQAEIEELAQTVIDGFGLAGMAVGIVQGKQVYARGFGVKNIETGEPVTERSLFHLASVSKPFVATAVLQLAERDALQLDAPIHHYLPDFLLSDERFRQITVRQMLHHTSGMPDTDDYGWDRPEFDDRALERYVHSLAQETLIAAPGETFAYSNMAYEVLGLLIARLAGQSFEDYIDQQILRPLEMESSTFLKTDVAPEHATTPHIVLPPTAVSLEYPYNRAHAPSSTLHSSALELCSWALMNLNRGEFQGRRLLQEDSYEQLWHPYRQTGPDHPEEFAGLGWFIDTYRGHRRIRHSGVDTGFQSDLVLLPDLSLGVILLANTIPAPWGAVMNAILDLLLGFEPDLPKPPVLLTLGAALSTQKIEAAAEEVRRLQKTQADQYDFGPEQFLDIGYTLLEVKRSKESLQVAQLGTQLFPDSHEIAELLEKINPKMGSNRAGAEHRPGS